MAKIPQTIEIDLKFKPDEETDTILKTIMDKFESLEERIDELEKINANEIDITCFADTEKCTIKGIERIKIPKPPLSREGNRYD